MDLKQKGFTLIEILVVVTIIGVLAGLVVVLIPKGQEKANIAECTNNQKQLVQTLISLDGTKFPKKYAGVNLLLYLFKAKHLAMAEDNLKLLFCPGDEKDGWDNSGGLQAYEEVDLEKAGEYGLLSSYAGRFQTDRECAASKSSTTPQAMTADDSDDHHNGKGFVIGYSSGAVKYKQKFDDWNIDPDTEVKVGEGSAIEDLKCLKTDD
jgi:prepilin-type N-terminal cleavage/methylation domain-containing protein